MRRWLPPWIPHPQAQCAACAAMARAEDILAPAPHVSPAQPSGWMSGGILRALRYVPLGVPVGRPPHNAGWLPSGACLGLAVVNFAFAWGFYAPLAMWGWVVWCVAMGLFWLWMWRSA